MRRAPRMVLRTIRNGRVRILGHEYAPAREPTPERFEGLRAAFGLYWGPPNFESYDERGLMDSVCLWGSEKAYRGGPEADWPGPFCEDGFFRWQWWKRVRL